jgi:streptogramin lyase
VVTLPEDSRPHASAVSATADFDGAVSVQPTFDLAASEIVAAVEQRLPGEAESPLRTESATGATGTTGTVLVRRVGFADDSVAGFEYDVTVEQGSQGWAVVSATKAAVCYRGVSGELCV